MTWHAPRIRVGSLVVKGEQVYTVEDFVDLSRSVLQAGQEQITIDLVESMHQKLLREEEDGARL